MSAKFYMTSTDVIAAVKRKISVPISQNTFTEDDILAFANETMMIDQVPSILQYHEEYLTTAVDIPLVDGQSRYQVPSRAIGQKLRDLFYKDTNGNIYEMYRINADDQAFFQQSMGTNQNVYRWHYEGNDIVLDPINQSNASGFLMCVYYLRPNMMVATSRAATIQSFQKTIITNNIAVNDSVTICDHALVAGIDYTVGLDNLQTTQHLATAINVQKIASAVVNGNVLTITYTNIKSTFDTTDVLKFGISSLIGFSCDQVPSHFTNGMLLDILQTNSGHRLYAMDVIIPDNGISGNIISLNASDVPDNIVIGDYLCTQYECIIPQIPDDLHIALVERICARVLSSLGDQAGLAAINQNLQAIEARQGNLIDNRNEGSPQKVLARHSLLRYNSLKIRRY